MKSKPAERFLEDYVRKTDLSIDAEDLDPSYDLPKAIEDEREVALLDPAEIV